jgi:hypothetical protein
MILKYVKAGVSHAVSAIEVYLLHFCDLGCVNIWSHWDVRRNLRVKVCRVLLFSNQHDFVTLPALENKTC